MAIASSSSSRRVVPSLDMLMASMLRSHRNYDLPFKASQPSELPGPFRVRLLCTFTVPCACARHHTPARSSPYCPTLDSSGHLLPVPTCPGSKLMGKLPVLHHHETISSHRLAELLAPRPGLRPWSGDPEVSLGPVERCLTQNPCPTNLDGGLIGQLVQTGAACCIVSCTGSAYGSCGTEASSGDYASSPTASGGLLPGRAAPLPVHGIPLVVRRAQHSASIGQPLCAF